ncbi:hypothetical protein IP78_09630 [Brevundimonas sp. AAP58]|uniref:hypothetical protein n=1 Tax=Brevundimonas sp. AAP58 TaxID=1523422 RepID=UPI0006B91B15|nr:hypothetical protein [Brevundimonas sp. AAP58]KPF79169.1 hypothetical protein IP78_09630 [Brevundimonas sp. AAP58]
MTSPRQSVDEQLAKLGRELQAVEAAHEQPKAAVRSARPVPKPIGAGEKLFRKILFGLLLAWSAIVFSLMALNNSWTLLEWIFAPIFMLAIALLIYGVALFQIELGKSVWSSLLKRNN